MGSTVLFKQSDIERAIRAVLKSGLVIQGVEVKQGVIRVVTTEDQEKIAKRPEPKL